MTKLVVDASVALKWAFEEPDRAPALVLRDDFVAGTHELLAPDVFVIEIGHAVSKLHRQGKITSLRADDCIADLFSTLPRLHPSFSHFSRAFEISLRSRASLYDCLYLALAEDQDCQLVTADRRLIRNVNDRSRIIHLSQL